MDIETQHGGDYRAFGLNIRSAIDLPELAAAGDDVREPDVTIEVGVLSDLLENGVDVDAWMRVAGDRFRLRAPPALYEARQGRSVIIDPLPGASARDIRLYLLGTVMTAVCHQRGLLPLHAAALDVGGEAYALAGPSGAGKSTLAAQFQRRGLTVLADDLCAVHISPGDSPRVWPGPARIKLWGGSPGLAEGAHGLERIGEDVNKFSLPLADRGPPRARPLTRLCILRPGDPETVEACALKGPEAIAAVLGAVHRWPLAVAMGRAADHLAQAAAIAARGEILELRFTHDPARPLALLKFLEKRWRL